MATHTKLTELPHDVAAEGAVIGSIIVGPEEIPNVVEHISRDDFVCEEAAELFQIVRDLWSKGKTVDGVLVRSVFAGQPNAEALLEYLQRAIDTVPSSANALFYAKCVRKKSIERQLIQLVDETRTQITDPNKSIDGKLAAVAGLLTACPEAVEQPDTSLTDLIDNYFLRSEQASGIPTGFPHLDRLTDGLKRGQLVLVGGPSSIGKSSLVLDFFVHAMRLGLNPYLVSLEMFNDEIAERMIRNIARVSSGFDLKDPNVIEAGQFIGKWPGSLAEKRDPNIDTLCAQILSKRQRDNIGIAFVDHLHLINAPGRSRYEQITYISKALKSLAMQAGIPVVVAAQLNRAPRQRTDHRPFMSDLRDSGSLEQDADVILLLYSKDYYRKQDDPQADLDGGAELIVAKNRNRPTGLVRLFWLPEFSTFGERSEARI
ncbi:MAG: replicative DNA helicase [Planctomycetota bacterium]|jgi:replicative DNA helicase